MSADVVRRPVFGVTLTGRVLILLQAFIAILFVLFGLIEL